MRKINNNLFYLLLLTTFLACNKDAGKDDPLPDNIIEFKELQHVWNWERTINIAKNDTMYPYSLVTYTFTDDGHFYDTEDSIKNNTYSYYVTSETQTFDNNSYHKLYLYFGGTKAFEKYFYLPNPATLVIYDGVNYTYKGYFKLLE